VSRGAQYVHKYLIQASRWPHQEHRDACVGALLRYCFQDDSPVGRERTVVRRRILHRPSFGGETELERVAEPPRMHLQIDAGHAVPQAQRHASAFRHALVNDWDRFFCVAAFERVSLIGGWRLQVLGNILFLRGQVKLRSGSRAEGSSSPLLPQRQVDTASSLQWHISWQRPHMSCRFEPAPRNLLPASTRLGSLHPVGPIAQVRAG
jgi:hypothetical protein